MKTTAATLRFRTPMRCQNGHFRFAYWEFRQADLGLHLTWGEKDPDCTCPSGALTEGFAPCGEDQPCIGLTDKHGTWIYAGDVVTVRWAKFWDYATVAYYPPRWGLSKGDGFCDDWTAQEWQAFEVIGDCYSHRQRIALAA